MHHPRSNARLVNEMLLSRSANEAIFFALNHLLGVRQLNDQFKEYFSPLDVCVLGMGDDGHTASLFPGIDQQWLAPDCSSLIAMIDPPGDLEPRVTLTARALLTARDIHILIHGEAKHTVLQNALSGDDISVMPVRSILQHAKDRVVVHYAKN